MHIHLDPVGGVAGDMFVAAMLDCWPSLQSDVIAGVRAAGLGEYVRLSVAEHSDGVLVGSRFLVELITATDTSASDSQSSQSPATVHSHSHEHSHDHAHHTAGSHVAEVSSDHQHEHEHLHMHWGELRQSLQSSSLSDAVKVHVIGIFGELAKAEAEVHGKDIDSVAFHEVGHWDSIADIVAASVLIDAVAASSWSVGVIPIGSGRINTAHGELAVPAPATSLLLKGFVCNDDGRVGERVTPTGAAILRYLSPDKGIGETPRLLQHSGFGFGTRRFNGISNVLRILVFDEVTANAGAAPIATDHVGVLQFEIDDQSGEELAVSLAHLRAHEGVIDVTQSNAIGKKNRMVNQIQLLVYPPSVEAVCEACFTQTTTLGIRTRIEQRRVLERGHLTTEDGHRVKVVQRPGGATAKTEMDDVSTNNSSHRVRAEIRRSAEQVVLSDPNFSTPAGQGDD